MGSENFPAKQQQVWWSILIILLCPLEEVIVVVILAAGSYNFSKTIAKKKIRYLSSHVKRVLESRPRGDSVIDTKSIRRFAGKTIKDVHGTSSYA